MGIIQNFTSKAKEFLNRPAEDYAEDEYIDDEFMDKDEYDEFPEAPKYSPYGEDYSYTPAGSDDEPQYESYEEVKKEVKSKTSKRSANIYNMNSTQKFAPKFSLYFLTLNDMYDAKNVADRIIDKNTLVIINLANLTDEQRIRAMDFLDGAKYVAKCIYTQLTEDVYAYIPGDVELHGDFLDQVDF